MREMNDVDNSNNPNRSDFGIEERNCQEAKSEDAENNIMQDQNYNEILRHGFIRKVYGILSTQLIITTSIICLSFIPVIKEALLESIIAMVFFWICLALFVVIAIVLACATGLARKVPWNYILLGLFTLVESYCLIFVSCTYDPQIVLIALIGTTGITIALTIYSFITKVDYTFYGQMLSVSLFIMIFGAIIGLFFWNYDYWNFAYCISGLIIYSLYLIYDTQLIAGKFGVEYQIDDYIIAALSLYLDIIQIFLRFLSLLSRANNNRS